MLNELINSIIEVVIGIGVFAVATVVLAIADHLQILQQNKIVHLITEWNLNQRVEIELDCLSRIQKQKTIVPKKFHLTLSFV